MIVPFGDYFDHIWCVDFEYGSGESGADAATPRCIVAKELLTQKTIRMWLDGHHYPECPFKFNEKTLYVAYYASAEISCHLSLGWPIPSRVIDLYAEYRWLMNGLQRVVTDEHKQDETNSRFSLLAAMRHFGLQSAAIDAQHKEQMRHLAMRGGTYTDQEQKELLDYNETDVVALEKLLPKMWKHLELRYALLRGRYMCRRWVPSSELEFR